MEDSYYSFENQNLILNTSVKDFNAENGYPDKVINSFFEAKS